MIKVQKTKAKNNADCCRSLYEHVKHSLTSLQYNRVVIPHACFDIILNFDTVAVIKAIQTDLT